MVYMKIAAPGLKIHYNEGNKRNGMRYDMRSYKKREDWIDDPWDRGCEQQ